MAKHHTCIIDGSNMIHRAWAMGRPRQRRADQLEVGATALFGQMLVKLMERMEAGRLPPTRLAIFFDPAREKSWRREVYPPYKAHRPPMDPAFAAQLPLMVECCQALGVACATAERHEADDLVAAYAEDAAARGDRVTVISSDKDLMQLVRPGVLQHSPVQDKWYDQAAVEKKFGVPPSQVRDFLAMAGDASDGIPGAPGVGPKHASDLLRRFGTIDEIIAQSEEIERPSIRKSIQENSEQILVSRRLASLDAEGSPRPVELSEMVAPDGRMVRGLSEAWQAERLT